MEQALRDAFAHFDEGGSGFIPSRALREVLASAGASSLIPEELLNAVEAGGEPITLENLFQLCTSLDRFLEGPGPQLGTTLSADDYQERAGGESPDLRVIEFISTLCEYQAQCEMAGNYDEAARCVDQLAKLRREEEGRRVQALKVRHLAERMAAASAQANQFTEFNVSWDRYLAEYDAMAIMYVKQLQERQLKKLRKAQEDLHRELVEKPVKFGREVLDWRAKEANLIKHHKYSDAARIKAVVEELERRERAKMDEERLIVFSQREARVRLLQKAELTALVKRIDTRRAGALLHMRGKHAPTYFLHTGV